MFKRFFRNDDKKTHNFASWKLKKCLIFDVFEWQFTFNMNP